MAPSVCLYTILFTLEDKPVHKNQYIQMFLIWFSYVIKSKSLDENDSFFIIGDRYTLNYLKHETPFESIAKLLLCKCIIFICLQGLYTLNPLSQKFLIICDSIPGKF